MKVFKAKLIKYTSDVNKYMKDSKPSYRPQPMEKNQKITISKGQQRFMQLASDLWKSLYGDKISEDVDPDFFLEFFDFLNKFSVVKIDSKHYRINGLFTREFVNDITKYINKGRKLVSMFEIITETKLLLFKQRYVKIHEFFIPDLYAILLDLFAKTDKKKYARYALILKENTWLKQVDNPTIKTRLYKSRLQDLKWKLKPFQEEFVVKYPLLKDRLQLRGYILAFDQGLGKTFTSLALMYALKKDLVVIFCPKTLMFNWKNEIKKIFKNPPDDNEIFLVGVDKEPLNPSTKYIISNYERIDEVNGLLQRLNKRNVGVIVDESQNFRNIKAKRTQALIQLVKQHNPSDVLLLSGTPIKSNYAEIAPYLAIIDPKFDDEVMRLWLKVYNIDMSVASDIIRYRLQLISFRKMKNEVLQLPEKKYIEVPVTIPNVNQYTLKTFKQLVKKLADQKIKEYLSKLDEYYQQFLHVLDSIKKLLLKHKQNDLLVHFEWYIEQVKNFTKNGILTNFDQIKDRLYQIEKEIDAFLSSIKAYKLKKQFQDLRTIVTRLPYRVYGEVFGYLLHTLRAKMVYDIFSYNIDKVCKLIHESSKTVIFTYVSSIIPKLKQLIESKCNVNVVTVTGETKDREAIINKFKTDPNVKVIIASYQVASVGLTLTEADTMIYADKPYRESDLKQAEDRIYRIGQDKPVRIIYLKLKSTERTLQDRIDQIVKYFGSIVNLVMQKPD